MGKKSCKKSKSKKGNPTTELPSATHRSGGNDESNTQTNHARTPNALVQAIETCSFHRLLVTYTDTICMASFFSNSNRGKNFAPPDLDVDSITESDDDYQIKRKEVESFIFKVLCEITKSFQKSSRPLQQYRTMCEREIKNMGGVKVIVPTGHGGGDHGASKTFVYTCGFTALKPTKYGPQGREILLQNIHRKIANKSNRIISFLYQRHKDGHPLKDGSTAYDQNSGISFVAQLPNKADVILLKATRMLEATRLYGLEGYNIILLIPVGERLKGKDNVKVNSVGRNEVTALAQGLEVDGHKFLESNGLKFHHEMQKVDLAAGAALKIPPKYLSCGVMDAGVTGIALWRIRNWIGRVVTRKFAGRSKRLGRNPKFPGINQYQKIQMKTK
eukprot:CAMPEP_0194310564 /NCGR_PEP_ID=MMETSP0171-20130528/7517_1 /TAXON_ID=218684 /ORGANISM="Corethron pennatum, Strain L29A3" /LENGTH=387 /DNA_ID=CAMNT_0039064255 /DNA_START=40 /DNA_END=1204 /DNA_ORIENTATION=-